MYRGKVLIVDDSVVFRSQVKEALTGVEGLETASASSGKLALRRLEAENFDLVTLDLEMPEMNGFDVLAEIRKSGRPCKVIVFSSHTEGGAQAVLEALRRGASDFVAKPVLLNQSEGPAQAIRNQLLPRVLQFLDKDNSVRHNSPQPQTRREWVKVKLGEFVPSIVVIGSSTGGPSALEVVFRKLPRQISVPILVVQHMPPVFTATLAKRLSEISGLDVREANHRENLLGGRVYIAPGGYHLRLETNERGPFLTLDQRPEQNGVRPCVDFLFESAARICGPHTLGIVLTGMGEDGKAGAIAIKNQNGAVLIQDKESCVVYGMPGAIERTGAFDRQLPLEEISQTLSKLLEAT